MSFAHMQFTQLMGIILIMVGLISILRTDKWVMLLVDSWPFGEFSDIEIRLMKIAWRIIGLIFASFGIWIIG